MGGFGSGNWVRWQPARQTVESCIRLAIGDIQEAITLLGNSRASAQSSIQWHRRRRTVASASYVVTVHDSPRVELATQQHGKEPRREVVRLRSSVVHFGGQRWWFACPLCNRQAGVIYLQKARN